MVDAITSGIICFLLLFIAQIKHSFGKKEKIYLPEDKKDYIWFDKIVDKKPNYFRNISSFGGFFIGSSFFLNMYVFIIFCLVFVTPISIYFFVLTRSIYYSVIRPEY